MVIDTSALVAILQREPERRSFIDAIEAADVRLMSVLLAAAVNSTVVAGENPTVGSSVWLPAASIALGR